MAADESGTSCTTASWPKPDDWQRDTDQLLTIDAGIRAEFYQRIPAKMQGDGGMEGFTSDGHGYQAYADQDSLNTSDRAKKQKKKKVSTFQIVTENGIVMTPPRRGPSSIASRWPSASDYQSPAVSPAASPAASPGGADDRVVIEEPLPVQGSSLFGGDVL